MIYDLKSEKVEFHFMINGLALQKSQLHFHILFCTLYLESSLVWWQSINLVNTKGDEQLLTQNLRRIRKLFDLVQITWHTGAKTYFLSGNYQEFDVWKMWILWKMRFWKMWILWKLGFWKCEFLDKKWIFAPVWLQ